MVVALVSEPKGSASPGWEPPEEFDGYRLLSELGKGAMGKVYVAFDAALDRPVAIKFLDVSLEDPSFRERFALEARAVARLQHPNVVTVYRVGEVDRRPYFVSELIRGRTLDRLELPLDRDRLLRIAVGLARGLAAAHRRNVLHRDVKPANAMVAEDGEVKLLDFGLAKLVAEAPEPETRAEGAAPLRRPRALPPEDALEVQQGVAPGAAGSRDAAHETRPGSARDSANETRPGSARDVANETRPGSARDSANETRPGAVQGAVVETEEGKLVGTPAYVAPEVWLGEPATFRSDVYSLGAVLYHLASGAPPHQGESLAALKNAVTSTDAAIPEALRRGDPRLATVLARCLARDPSLRPANAEEVREALEALAPEQGGASVPEGNPYRGLHAFEAEHRGLFFGRDSEIRAVIDRLRHDAFVLIAGTSGVGKSSLCRAGVLPRVADGALDARSWTVATVTPGKHPLAALAGALAGPLAQTEDEVAAQLLSAPREVARVLRRKRPALIVFLDQLEELVTLSAPEEAQALAQWLEESAVPGASLRVLASVRGDFLARLTVLPGLAEIIPRALYLLAPLFSENIREAIVGPARARGVTFESDALVQTLVTSADRAEGALPLLQFALSELWQGRDAARGIIPLSALEAMGGVSGSLGRHADGVISRLSSDQRIAARRMLLQLVTDESTRARRREQDLIGDDPRARAALAALVHGRLLTTTETPEGFMYEVAHEALIASWPALRGWLANDADRRQLRDRLTAAFAEWERHGRNREGLWSGQQLAEAARLETEELQPRERAFLEASRRAVAARKRTWMMVGVAALSALVLTGLLVRLKLRQDEHRRVDALLVEADTGLSRARGELERFTQLREGALALFDASKLGEAEKQWAEALNMGAQCDAELGRVGQTSEGALLLRPDSARARQLLAQSLDARAELAETLRHFELRDEWLARLALYDDDGSLRSRWSRKGSLLVTAPEGFTLTFEAENGSSEPFQSGIAVALAAGAYTVRAEAKAQPESEGPARPAQTLRTHVLIRRGEPRRLELTPPSSTPGGLVWIPRGQSLFGSAAEEGLRRDFFRTVPIHEVETDGYFIAREETTFGDWLRFLDSLPPAERERRSKFGSGGLNGSLSLSKSAGRWQIRFRPTVAMHQALEGERIHYAGRERDAEQDWRRMPVVGISLDDARAYLEWLNRSGQVPGARLCTEREWERAARGADGREYPSGPALSARDANFDETYGKQPAAFGPDEVGAHPRSRSPFGVDDLAGNAWEWTRSSLHESEAVIRGGSYYFGRNSARSSNREVVEPAVNDLSVGLRVCAGVQ